MNCCHVKNQCLVIRLPKEIDHCQAEQIRQECERSFMNFLLSGILFLIFRIPHLWIVQESD